MSVAVEAHGVAKRYGNTVAVEDLTFSAAAGEILGVLGPNGAGKTTAIRVLTTILAPSRGSFVIAGIPHTRPDEIRRRIGVLPESAGYPERQTGAEFLRFHARLFRRGRGEAAIAAGRLLEEVGLADRGRSLIGTYSRGMRQRLGIARALLGDPSVVVLDEPTLGLDPAGQRQVMAMIRRIAYERGATVLLSTHLLAEVEETCTRVLILHHGRVISAGSVAEVARRAAAPRHAVVRVAPEHLDAAVRSLAGTAPAATLDGGSGSLRVTLGRSDGNAVLRALAATEIPVRGFELEGSRLSDAFLAMTGRAEE